MEQTPETMRLALESIASMDTDTQTPHELLVLCVTIARIELEKDFDGVVAIMDNAIESIR